MSDVKELISGSVGFQLLLERGGIETMSADVFSVHMEYGLRERRGSVSIDCSRQQKDGMRCNGTRDGCAAALARSERSTISPLEQASEARSAKPLAGPPIPPICTHNITPIRLPISLCTLLIPFHHRLTRPFTHRWLVNVPQSQFEGMRHLHDRQVFLHDFAEGAFGTSGEERDTRRPFRAR